MLPEVPDRLQDCLQPPGEHVAGIGPAGRSARPRLRLCCSSSCRRLGGHRSVILALQCKLSNKDSDLRVSARPVVLIIHAWPYS